MLLLVVLGSAGAPLYAQSPLQGLPAADFELDGADSKSYRLSDNFDKNPVVVVFFRGVW
jgi:peroxiredoxin